MRLPAAVVFDYCFVALRKPGDAPFVTPVQPFAEGPHWSDENIAIAASG